MFAINMTTVMTIVTLACRCRHISDVGFAALENLPNLLTLDATKCHSLSDDGVGHLAQGCSSLRTLTLSECVHITNQGEHSPGPAQPRYPQPSQGLCISPNKVVLEVLHI